MRNYKLAWRNLWRNRRRTLITVASVFFAVFFALLFRSLQIGSYDYMYKSTIETYSGYLQLQHANWWDDKTVDHSFSFNPELEDLLIEDENVDDIIPRVESFALAYGEGASKGVIVKEIDPDKEQLLSDISGKKVKYRLNEEAVKKIKTDPLFNDKVRKNAELFTEHSFTNEIKGLVKLPVPDLNNSIVYMPYDIARNLYKMGDNLTSLVIHLHQTDDKDVAETEARLNSRVPEGTRVVDWKEMNEVLIQQMEADNISGIFMIALLYMVIAFGVFGTVLMMTAERRREFGVLVAIGMQRKKLASVISIEMIYIGLMGIVLGALVCIPIITYGHYNPIVFKGEMAYMMEDYGFEPKLVFEPLSYYFLWQAFIVSLMVLVSLIYPVQKILIIKVVNALKA